VDVPEPVLQILLASAYYGGLLVIIRLAGKRLAGQTTTFDLVVLITLAVVLQETVLRQGTANALIFVATVFVLHRGLAMWCARSRRMRRLIRGAPRPLVRDGEVSYEALEDEGLSYDDLLAGLRKLGHEGPQGIRLATLEETGHISAVAEDEPSHDARDAPRRKQSAQQTSQPPQASPPAQTSRPSR
jgi:uncharacterized membrane protein YcaP (DUF421 family)